MTRETKLGLAMVALMIGVFGFLVYKRINRPDDEAALQAANEPSSGETKLIDDEEDEEEFAASRQPKILPVAGQAKPIAEEEQEEVDDPFGAPEKVATSQPTRPNLPTEVPDEREPDETANDPFGGMEESDDATTGTVKLEPEIETEANDPFAGGGASQEMAADEGNSEDNSSGPALGFEAVTEIETKVEAEIEAEPVSTPRITLQEKQPAATRSFAEERFVEEEAETVSIRARATVPESKFLEEEILEEETSATMNDLPATERSETPQLMLDDSEEDRYGGFRAVEVVDEQTLEVAESPRETAQLHREGRADLFNNHAGAHSGRTHVVKPNETFWSISQKYYSSGRFFQALAAYNHRQIPDPTKMKPGVTIVLPSEAELEHRYPSLFPKGGPAEPAAAEAHANQPGELINGRDGRLMYRVGAKDTLSGIAQAHLGRASRWVQILEMNRDVLKDEKSLKIGMVLRLPHDARSSQVTGQSDFFR